MSHVLQSWANSKTHKNLLVFVDKNTTIPNLPERCLLFNAGPGVLDVLRFGPFNTAVYVSLCVSEEDTYMIASRYWDVTYGDPQKAPLFAKVKIWADGLRLVPRQRASLYRSMIVGTEEQLAHLRKHDALVNLVSFSDAELVGIHKKVCSMSERNKFDAAFVCGGVSIDARIVAEDAAREVWVEDGVGPEKKGLVPRVGDGALDKIRLPKPSWVLGKGGLHVTCTINVLHNHALFEALRHVGEMDKTVQVELPNVEGAWTMRLCEWRWSFSPFHAHEAFATWTLSFLSEADELAFVKSGTTNPTHHAPTSPQPPLSPRRSHFIGINDGPPVQKDVLMSLTLDGKATWQPDDARIKVDQPIRIKIDQLEREVVEREWNGGVMAKATAALETKKALDARWASQEKANVDGTKVDDSDGALVVRVDLDDWNLTVRAYRKSDLYEYIYVPFVDGDAPKIRSTVLDAIQRTMRAGEFARVLVHGGEYHGALYHILKPIESHEPHPIVVLIGDTFPKPNHRQLRLFGEFKRLGKFECLSDAEIEKLVSAPDDQPASDLTLADVQAAAVEKETTVDGTKSTNAERMALPFPIAVLYWAADLANKETGSDASRDDVMYAARAFYGHNHGHKWYDNVRSNIARWQAKPFELSMLDNSIDVESTTKAPNTIDARLVVKEETTVDGTKVVASDLTVFPLVRQSEPRVDRAMEAIKRVGDADDVTMAKAVDAPTANVQPAVEKEDGEELEGGWPYSMTMEVRHLPILTHVRELEEFDGPILTEWISDKGNIYVEKWCTNKGGVTRTLFVRSNHMAINAYLNGTMSMMELLTGPNDNYGMLVDRNKDGIVGVTRVQVPTLPASYLPSPTTMHDIDLRKDWTTEPSSPPSDRASLIAIKTALDALVAEIMVSSYAGILTRLPVKKFIPLVEKHTAHIKLPSPPAAP